MSAVAAACPGSPSAAAGSASSASSSISSSRSSRMAPAAARSAGSTARRSRSSRRVRRSARNARPGRDANTREDCRIVGYINSIQSYWSTGDDELHDLEDRVLHRLHRERLRDRRRPTSARSTARSTRRSTSTSASSTSCARASARAPGPLAQAYVLAHEYGHHVQDQLGILDRIGNDHQGPRSAGVKSELQADCFAGVWAHHAAQTSYLTKITPADVQRRAERCRSGRRRPHPGGDAGPGQSGDVDARLVEGARPLVHGRLHDRQPEPVRHLEQALTDERVAHEQMLAGASQRQQARRRRAPAAAARRPRRARAGARTRAGPRAPATP